MKYALLDTDFISKAHIIRDEKKHLIDRVLELKDYSFYCHEQVSQELSRHNGAAAKWLGQACEDEIICLYTDEQIIKNAIYGPSSMINYNTMLRNACNAVSPEYYKTHYSALAELDYSSITPEDFLSELHALDYRIGEGQDLGEIKTFVLMQWLHFLYGDKLFFFCSDDKEARNEMLSFGDINIQCISLVSSFSRLLSAGIMNADSAKPFIDSALRFFDKNGIENIRLVENSKEKRMLRVSCKQVFDDLLNGRLVELKNGFLMYKK